MAQKLSVSDVVHQMDESDSEWCESEDDMVSSDVEGEVDSFCFTQEDPLESAQQVVDDGADVRDPATDELADESQVAPSVQQESQESEIQPEVTSTTSEDQDSSPTGYVPTSVFQGVAGPLTSLDAASQPYEFFELIWGEDTCQFIADQSNLYAAQKGSNDWVNTNDEEMQSFIGMLIAMGIHKLPSIKDYWSQHALLGVPGITRGMPRKRFLSILSHLHLNDNSKMPTRDSLQFDKLYKVRTLLGRIKDNSQTNYYPHQQLAVDEAMILFKGRSTLKQYMPLKPCKRGYKSWCMCDSYNGYMYNIDIYAGKSVVGSNEDGLGTRVVKSMMEPLYDRGHHIYMDNFFSNVELAKFLEGRNTYTIGTARVNSKGWPLALKNVKALTKELERGDHRSAMVLDSVQCQIWKDKKAVAFINTVCSSTAQTQVLRRNKDGSRVSVPWPESVKLYNSYMGGVDLFDARRKNYSSSRKSKKWWLRIFYFLLDTAVVNNYILYKEKGGTKSLALKEFILDVAEHLMSMFLSRKRHLCTIDAPVAARLRERHFPDEGTLSRQCRVCSKRKRTRFYCKDCCPANPVPLCPTKCFRVYHTTA